MSQTSRYPSAHSDATFVERHCLPALRSFMEVGHVALTRTYLTTVRSILSGNGKPGYNEFLDTVEGWLANASEHERVHGKGSMLNRQHPIYLDSVRP